MYVIWLDSGIVRKCSTTDNMRGINIKGERPDIIYLLPDELIQLSGSNEDKILRVVTKRPNSIVTNWGLK